MLKIENLECFNLEGAFRGLRNPMNSWSKSDSEWSYQKKEYIIGEKDLDLAKRMIKAGASDRKFLRQIMVCMDITAPLYWWKEIDQYKVATTTNSCSTMHKLATTPITKDCFSFDGSDIEGFEFKDAIVDGIISSCEKLRQAYSETKDKGYWRLLVQLLPNAWNQKRTYTCNYETLKNIVSQRRGHKLSEWREFIEQIESLPYYKELIANE